MSPIFSLVISDEINPHFLKDYFLHKNVQQTVLFACWNCSSN